MHRQAFLSCLGRKSSRTSASLLRRGLPRLSATKRCYSYSNGGHPGSPRTSKNPAHARRLLVVLATASVVTYGVYRFLSYQAYAEAPPEGAPVFERARIKKDASKEENRDLLSSQHLQVKKSWERPGVHAWGSNSGRVVAPDTEDALIKAPRRIPFFDGILLRDLKLDRMFGAAIDENGDLLQWGALYSTDQFEPTVTLKGKNLVSLVLSRDRIVALGKNGTVYSLPVPRADQESGPKPQESTWLPFRSVWSPISYRTIHPKALSWGERVCKISGGLEHVLLLTSSGRLFSAASASEDFPSQGQLGIPALTWLTRPEGPYDQAHEIGALRGFRISQIAAGDFHSLALDKDGRIFSFGSNAEGQLGLDLDTRAVTVDNPSLLPIQKLYNDTRFTPAVTGIAAGGANSFFTVDATPKVLPGEVGTTPATSKAVTADTFSCGLGIWGGLGNGRWTHVQRVPTKMKALSGLFEYDETKNQVIPIRLASISVGASHACAVMDNVTYVGAHERSSPNDTNWGADVLWWGNNEFYQLGTRRRNNISNPTYIPPLDTDAEREKGRREEHRFQITPRKMVSLNGRNVGVEQRVECGRNVSAVYSVV